MGGELISPMKKFTTDDYLAPGKMSGLDRICDGLIHDRSFLVEG
jgi:hypothetical protein